jgi:hypothetical protein
MNVSIPAGSDGEVQIPVPIEFSSETVTEGGRVVWENGRFVPGDSGVSDAKRDGQTLQFDLASGKYAFQLNGQ